jgi:hypothetical protein
MNSHEYQDFYKPFTKVNWSMCELNRQNMTNQYAKETFNNKYYIKKSFLQLHRCKKIFIE